MNAPVRPHIECEQHHTILFVSDVRAAADFYTQKLGFTLAFSEGEPPSFAGVNLGQVQIFLQQGTPAPAGCSVYFVVGNADELCEFHRANLVDVVEGPEDRPYKLRDYTIRDPFGYYLTFGHRLRASESRPPTS
jgi:catechol 2,3-dioxygenase-like lactoylglutathione lyase family enzyme